MKTSEESSRASSAEPRDPLDELRARTREQLEAAWQLHVDRVEQELAKGWREQIEAVLDERLAALTQAVETLVEQRVAARLDSVRLSGGRVATETLSLASRHISQSENPSEWAGALVDSAAVFCGGVALFRLVDEKLRLERASGLPALPLEVPLSYAPALRQAIESREPIVASHSAGELSAEIAALGPAPPDGKMAVFPIVCQARAVGALCTQRGENPLDFHALELLATMAGAALERSLARRSPNLIAIAGEGSGGRSQSLSWGELSRADQEKHIRAQRFARVRIAEMRLYRSAQVKQGRAEHALYRALRTDIDAAREAFRAEHLGECASMVDYIHLEIVRTLANDDDTLLGGEYPGPLV